MRICLVSMPWHPHDYPSTSISVLRAYLLTKNKDRNIDCLHEHLRFWSYIPEVYSTIARIPWMGETLYSPFVFAETNEKVAIESAMILLKEEKLFLESIKKTPQLKKISRPVLKKTIQLIDKHLDDAVATIGDACDILGFSTSAYQLFSSLAFAKRIKKISPNTKIILGGSGVSVLPECFIELFDYIDFVVQGEGEKQLETIVSQVEENGKVTKLIHGLYTKHNTCCSWKENTEGPENLSSDEIDEMLFPDFSEFEILSDENSVPWCVPIEASRGCRWDRRVQKQNRRSACCFCGTTQPPVNSRKRDVSRVAKEVLYQSNRYKTTRFHFFDNEIECDTAHALAELLKSHKRNYKFALDLRVDVTPEVLVLLYQAGCSNIQFGIEGLSNDFLQRINKGTSVIQNLAAMRALFELGIDNHSNLIIGFPGTTDIEIFETANNIKRYGICYQPLKIAPYTLQAYSVMAEYPEQFGIAKIDLPIVLKRLLPKNIADKFRMPWLDYRDDRKSDWSPVIDAVKQWQELHEFLKNEFFTVKRVFPLYFLDGENFLEIVDQRSSYEIHTLDEIERAVYLSATTVQHRKQIYSSDFVRRLKIDEPVVDDIIEQFVSLDLMYCENERFLSLAICPQIEY